MRISDYIAQFFKDKGVDLAFAITGSGSIRLIESFEQAGLSYVCPHQEQAGIMASLVRMRASGNPAVMMVTGGPGASNTLIGLADAHLDSMPLFILAGQENLEYVHPANEMRGKGVQGLDMVDITKTVTKFGHCLTDPKDIKWMLEKAYHLAYSGRPGPVWLEIPQNLQHAQINPDELVGFTPDTEPDVDLSTVVNSVIDLIKQAERPLFWIGHGVRIANGIEALERVQTKINMPSLVSWQAADILCDDDPNFVGRAGTYGQRFANLALQNCDLLITIGTRLALPQRGFNDLAFSRASKKVIVDIDPIELNKYKFNVDIPVLADAGKFLEALDEALIEDIDTSWTAWRSKIMHWQQKYPMAVEPTDLDAEGINSYWFINVLSQSLHRSYNIVTDMGTSLTCTHAGIKLQKGQRLMTSTGLGEMGFGLPGAIGAALYPEARRKTILIAGEGSFMMNLQELQTMKEQNLDIKIFLLNNNGYLTIKHTHNAIYQSAGAAGACGPSSGVTFPDFKKVIEAFGFEFRSKSTARNLEEFIREILNHNGPIVAEIKMPEFQELIPKSAVKTRPDGTMYSSPLEDLYPFLTKEELESEMIIPLMEN